MQTVTISKAKARLSRLVRAVERGQESEVIITHHGRPMARLVAFTVRPVGRRIGVAKGRFVVPDSIDAEENAIVTLFNWPHG